MDRIDGRPVYSATDLVAYLACEHLTQLERAAIAGLVKRPIRDDVQDHAPHGTLDLEHGLVVSCNAYFAQLGTYEVGAQALHDTTELLGIAASSPDTSDELKKSLLHQAFSGKL